MSFRLCWALCSHQVPSSCSTCTGMCFGSRERLAHWDYSQNLCFSFPFLILLQTRRFLYCQAKCSLSVTWQNGTLEECNASSVCSHQCPPEAGLAWADPQAWSTRGGRSCLQAAPCSHLSCWCTVQRVQTPGATWIWGVIPTPHSTQESLAVERIFHLFFIFYVFPLYRSLYPFALQKIC